MIAIDSRRFTLDAEGVVGTLYLPRSDDPFPGVLLIGGSDGREPQMSAEGLAQQGFATLAVAYFGRPGLPPSLRDVPLEYFERALIALRRALAPRHGPLVVLGTSRGSEAALLMGVHFPELVSAVIGMVPGNVILCSWPPGGPAWTLRGQALPFVSRFGPSADNPEAVIPVERIQGPILLISAGEDKVWPSHAMAEAMAERLRASGHPYADEHVGFPFFGHYLGRPGVGVHASPGTSERTAPDPVTVERHSPLSATVQFLSRVRQSGPLVGETLSGTP